MIIKRSEHGLGHLLPPVDDDADWKTIWWQHAMRLDLRTPSDEPEWFDVIAAGRLTVTAPTSNEPGRPTTRASAEPSASARSTSP